MTAPKHRYPYNEWQEAVTATDHTPTHRADDDRWHVRLGRALAGWGQDGDR